MPAEVISYRKLEEVGAKKVPTYYPELDRDNYSILRLKKSGLSYLEERDRINDFTNKQIETLLGERFNVLLSSFIYEIREGVIYGENSNEPFMDTVVRGRNYRRVRGNLIDREREDAEVIGLQATQENLCRPEAKPGTMIVSISLPGREGSSYQHNFYDIFTLREGSDGKRFIEARRYSSNLDARTAITKSRECNQNTPIPFFANAEHFLAHPFEVKNDNLKSPEDVHRFLHREHDYMDNYDFQEILTVCAEHRKEYLSYMEGNPEGEEGQYEILNAILNKAEEVNLMQQRRRNGKSYTQIQIYSGEDLRREISYLGVQPVKERSAGCGFSGGFGAKKNVNSPFSVAEFGIDATDRYGSREFKCPNCKMTNIRPENELLKKCQHCGSSAVSCEPEISKGQERQEAA